MNATTFQELGTRAYNFVVHPPHIVLTTISAVAMNIFYAAEALPLYGAALGMFVWKVTAIFDQGNILQDKILSVNTELPYLKYILIVAAIAISLIVPVAGLFTGMAFGIYFGPIAESWMGRQ